MPRFRVTRRYSSAGFGPWQAGAEMDLSEEVARWLNNDSAGLLVPVVEPEPEPVLGSEPEPEPAEDEADGGPAEAADEPKRNRQHKAGRVRA